MDNKKITFHTTIKKTATQQPIETTWCVFASDYNSVQVEFAVSDLRQDELRTVNPTIILVMEDGSVVQRTKEEIVQKNNVFSYKLKDNEGKHTGAVKAQLLVETITEEKYYTNIYTFTILESLDSVPVPKEFVIDDIQNILQEVKHHITHVFKGEIERERVFKEYVANIQLSEKQRETWFNQSQQTRASLFQVFMDEAQEVLKDAQQVKDLFDELVDKGIIESNINEKLVDLEESYAPRLSTLEQNDVTLTAQLQHIDKAMKPATSLGLIPNNISEAENNYTKLVNGLVYFHVVIDDYYYIKGGSTSVIPNLSISGVNGRLHVLPTTTILFNGSILAEKIVFDGESSSHLFISTTDVLKHATVRNNTINKIPLLHLKTSFVDIITFSHNDIDENSGIILQMGAVDFSRLNVKNNTVRNMDKQIINASSCGNIKSIINMEYNIVENDSDFWASAGTMYLAFSVYTGRGKLNYQNNSVTGLKTRLPSTNVYDSYFNGTEIVYKGNIWKNNVSVSTNKTRNSFVKAKGTSKVTVVNNIFLVTDDFIDSLTVEEKKNAWVTTWDFIDALDWFTFENNTIHAYRIQNLEYERAEKININNNIITATYLGRVLFNFGGTGSSSSCITNNTVLIDEVDGFDVNYSVYAPSVTGIGQKHKSFIFSSNIIKMAFANTFKNLHTDLLEMSNNIITNTQEGYGSQLSQTGTIDTVEGYNNVIKAPNMIQTFSASSPVKKYDYVIDTSGVRSESLRFSVDVKTISITVEFNNVDGLFIRHYLLKIGVDDGGRFIDYVNASGQQVKSYNSPLYSRGDVILNDKKTFQATIYNASTFISFSLGDHVGKQKISIVTYS